MSDRQFHFQGLPNREDLSVLNQHFSHAIEQVAPELANPGQPYDDQALITCAVYFEDFISQYFDIEASVQKTRQQFAEHVEIFEQFQKVYMLPKVINHGDGNTEDFASLHTWLLGQLTQSGHDTESDLELAVARCALQWHQQSPQSPQCDKMQQWVVAAMHSDDPVRQWPLLKTYQKIDFASLIPVEHDLEDKHALNYQGGVLTREAFEVHDDRMHPRQVIREINHCRLCHDKGNDSCSTGFFSKKSADEDFRRNPLSNILSGCPLEQKISQMIALKKQGHLIAALAVMMIDNPMCPATGHRICNDCMKSCIYQKQEPVDIPQVETAILRDVLALPWGVEIYQLLLLWNPLDPAHALPQPLQNQSVAIMGQGPAGFTMAHYLTRQGYQVVAMDGVKIEPLPDDWLKQPIKHFDDLEESLEDRTVYGFGGVAEYGITNRYDKNLLKLIYIALARRENFHLIDNVRFGGTVTLETFWSYGIDHVVLAVGAGLPQALPVKNSMAPGMRQANDFLMALQLTEGYKKDRLSSLEVDLPAIIIGGGLTAVDTACEVQAFYCRQVMLFCQRFERLQQCPGLDVKALFSGEDWQRAQTLLARGEQLRALDQLTDRQQAMQRLIALITAWGGVKILYRRLMTASPAYQSNSEELHYAFRQGVQYLEGHQPTEVILDEYGRVEALQCDVYAQQGDDWQCQNQRTLPVRTLLTATGAKTNVAYTFEHRHDLQRKGFEYQLFQPNGQDLHAVEPAPHPKSEVYGPFASYSDASGRRVSVIGDAHATFHGSVVKAIASAKRSYPYVSHALQQVTTQPTHPQSWVDRFTPRVHALTVHPHWIDLHIHAPHIASIYQPGQMLKLQNYLAHAHQHADIRFLHEPLALVPYACDAESGLIKFLILTSSMHAKMVKYYTLGQKVALMGPTGVRSKIPEQASEVVILTDAVGLAHAHSYGMALIGQQHQVKIHCCLPTQLASVTAIFSQDLKPHISIESQLPGAMASYHLADRIMILGHADFVSGVAPHFATDALREKTHVDTMGPMQCMLKGVCAQCLQWQLDEQGRRLKAVYACSWQNQPLKLIDFEHLQQRQKISGMMQRFNEVYYRHVVDPEQ